MDTDALHRMVRLTARTSALLFTATQATAGAGPRAERAARPLYLAFVVAHAVHFAFVARYAVATGGRDLFPGGRSLRDAGGWPTVVGIYGLFFGLAATGWRATSRGALGRRRRRGAAANAVIAGMFVSPFLGQVSRSRWYVVPAAVVAAASATATRRAFAAGPASAWNRAQASIAGARSTGGASPSRSL